MRPVISAAVAAAALLGATGAAHAVSEIKFDPLTARFIDAIGGSSVSILPEDDDFSTTPSIRWGTSTGSGQSGYDFATAATPLIASVDPVLGDTVFGLGAFTHLNNPVTGGAITAVTLEVTGNIFVTPEGGSETPLGPKTFVFDILHDETPNGIDPCLFGGDNDQGVNINGCADRVRISEDFETTASFMIGTVEYTLDILGFFDEAANDGDGAFDQEFLSAEELTNDRVLRARFTEKANIIPVPAGALLIGTALLGAGAVRRLSTRRG